MKRFYGLLSVVNRKVKQINLKNKTRNEEGEE